MDDLQKLPPPITGRDIVRILRRRRTIAVATFLVVVAATAALTSLMKPVYEATARVRIVSPGQSALPTNLMELLKGGAGASLDTQIEVLRSRRVMHEVIRKARLKTDAEELLSRLQFEPGSGEGILSLKARARSAPEAARTANVLSRVFRENTRAEGDKAASSALYGLSRALRVAEREKNDAIRAKNAFVRQIGVSNPTLKFEQRALHTVQAERALETLRGDLQVERRTRERHAANMQRIAPTIVTGFTQTKNAAIDKYELDINDLKRERAEKLLDYTEESEEVREIDAKIAAAKAGIQRALQNVYSKGSMGVNRNPDYSTAVTGVIGAEVKIASLQAGIRANEALLGRLQSEQRALAETRSRYEELERRVADAVAHYQQLKRGRTEVNVRQLTAVPTVQILDTAQVPTTPVSPKPLLNALMALFLGLFLAVAAALLSEYLAETNGQEGGLGIPHVAGVPLLGSVPVALPAPEAGSLPVPVQASTRAEDGLREIGYNLAHLRHRGAPPVVLLVGTRTDDTSPAVAAQLAATLVRDGLRITLVDADRARPRLNRVFGAPDAPGMTDVLAGRADIKDILHIGADGNLRFLAAGSPADDTPLTERGLRGLFKDLSADTDLVLVNGPSVFRAPLVAALARAADGLVLVTPSDGPAEESVARARRLLTNGYQPDILGVIVSETPETPAKEIV